MKLRNDPMIRLYENTQDWLQERGRLAVMIIGILVGAVVLYTAGDLFFSYQKSKAERAFAEAYQKYSAPVLETATTNPVGKYYSDEKTKWSESAEAFERLANEYSRYSSMGRYYAGVSYLHLDHDKGMQMLQQVADKNDQPTSDLARLALAEGYASANDTTAAINTYNMLLNSSYVPKQSVQLGLARAYEKTGKTQEAIDLYFEVAKVDRSNGAGSEAEKRLSALAPDRIKELPPPTQDLPTP